MSANEWITLLGLGVALIVGAASLGWLLLGLFRARSLVRRELSAYFLSPIAYVLFAVFLVLTGHLFSNAVRLLTETGPVGVDLPTRLMFGDPYFWLVFLFIPPVLTMRSFAEERSTGTFESLMTAPLREWQIVAAKFAACFLFYVILWLPTLAYLPLLLDLHVISDELVITPFSVMLTAGVLAALVGFVLLIPRVGTPLRLISVLLVVGGTAVAVASGLLHYRHDEHLLLNLSAGLDPAPVLTLYLGVMLAGAMFLAIGLFISSLVRDQLVAALISLAIGLVFTLAGFL